MKKFLFAAAAVAAIATPAAARDGSPYVGIEGGVLMPRDIDGDVDVDFTAGGLADVNADDVFQVDYKLGRDLDIIAGYDFGMFRIEGEAAWKRAKFDDIEFDDSVSEDVEDVLDFDDGDVEISGRTKVRSLMVNGLVDFGVSDNVSAFVGAGVGRARARLGGQSDKSTALQLLAGVRTAVSDNIDLGLKYRYFRTGKLDFATQEAFNGDIDADGDMDTGTIRVGSNKRFASHSLLASLIFNFGAPAVDAPVVVAAPPPPPAPATQTCPDGSVILATEMCPMAPPPPPPAPAPAGERG